MPLHRATEKPNLKYNLYCRDGNKGDFVGCEVVPDISSTSQTRFVTSPHCLLFGIEKGSISLANDYFFRLLASIVKHLENLSARWHPKSQM